MRKKRLLSGLAAFVFTVSAATVYAEAELKAKFNFADIMSYFNGTYDGTLKSYDFDVNCDNEVNILDLLYSKSEAEGEIKIDAEKMDVEYLNNVAAVLANELRALMQEMEIKGVTGLRQHYSSEDADKGESFSKEETEILNYLDEIAEYYGTEKWSVDFSGEDYSASCVTGDAVLQRTGAYPAAIPRSLNIPYSDKLTEQASEFYYDWKKDFGQYVSSDPAQAKLSDFSAEVMLNERKSLAKNLFTVIQTIAQEFETMGKDIPDGIISSDDDSEFVKQILKYSPEYSKVKWSADISSCVVNGVIAESPKSGYCSAYPNTIPDRMNVPYSDKLIKYASDMDKVWIEDFSECVTTDAEQLEYAEISEKVFTSRLNEYAKIVFTEAQTLLQEYETRGIAAGFDESSSGSIQQELRKMLPPELLAGGLKWEILDKDYIVNGVIVTDGESTGAFPNVVPSDMRIPYSRELLKYSAGTSEIWKENFAEYTLETVTGEYPPNMRRWLQKAYINSCNSNAKNVFAYAQTVLQEMETRGDKLPEGMITSDDDTDLVKEINKNLYSSSAKKWAVYVSDGVVKGAVYSVTDNIGEQIYDREKGKFVYMTYPDAEITGTGSYPNYVSTDKLLSYDHSLVKNYSKPSDSWNWDNVSSENNDQSGNTDEQPSGSISQAQKALINTYNSNAQTMYSTASYIFLEYEISGEPLPDGLITSDDKSEAAARINASVIGSANRKWAVYSRNGMIAGIVYTENGAVTGSYPSTVSEVVKYDHNLALKYADNSMKW